MKNSGFSCAKTAGFTLLELIVVIAIITLLAGVLTPLVKSSLDDAKTAKAVALVQTFKKAAYKYMLDLDSLPVEDATTHNLFATTGSAKWKGPYIDNPINAGTSPYGGTTSLKATLTGTTAGNNGYTVGGAAQAVGSAGAELVLVDVPDVLATKLNEAIDGAGEASPDSRGACEYGAVAAEGSGAGNRTVYIFLFKQ